MADSFVYIAIDFGTAYSGYSLHVDDSDYKDYSWGVEYGIRSCKTPTCILFDKRKNFKSFGYAALKEYSKKDASKSTYFFENFKMTLYKNPDIHSDFELTATNGEKMSALKVFSESLRFLKDHALETILNYSEMTTVSDVTWILTVPAIWSNAAKDFMRKAAMQAGLVDDLEPDKLMFALEPEAASVYCKNLPDPKFPRDQPKLKLDESPGMQYIVADCGGGTIDVTVHEVLDKGQLKEVYVASGNGLGGQNVDMKLTSFLQEICGDDCWEEYRKKHTNDLHHTLVKFAVSKCYEDNEGYSFICSHTLVELIKKHRKQDIASVFDEIEGATWDEDDSVIEISHTKFRSFFEESLRGIHKILDDIIKKPELHIRYLILVGGFSSSKILQDYIKDKFGSKCTVICPLLPQEAVVSGAALFGRNPGIIASRISALTYGIAVAVKFNESKHKGRKPFINSDSVAYCQDCFERLVKVGESILYNETRSYTYSPIDSKQKDMSLTFYSTVKENAEYVDESGLHKQGSMILSMPDIQGGLDRKVRLDVNFGFTEITATATDLTSKNTKTIKINFVRE